MYARRRLVASRWRWNSGGIESRLDLDPGDYAAAEAIKALRLGLSVMLFSDNVSLAHECAIKTLAREKNLLVKVLTFVAWIFGSLVGFMTGEGCVFLHEHSVARFDNRRVCLLCDF